LLVLFISRAEQKALMAGKEDASQRQLQAMIGAWRSFVLLLLYFFFFPILFSVAFIDVVIT
jgi:hypothetical protein